MTRPETSAAPSDMDKDPAAGTEDLANAGHTENRQTAHDDVLFEKSDSENFRARWRDVQAAFVDDPQRAVHDADRLVAELMQTLAATFAQRKQSLESQWQRSGEAETEDLRLALRSYRSFFDQMLPRTQEDHR